MPGLCQVGRRVTQLFILMLMIRKTQRFLMIDHIQKVHDCLRQHFFFHYDAAFVIKLALVPESAVRQVMFACSSIYCELFCDRFVMSPSLVSARLRGFSFRIWHNRFILTFSIFPNGGQCHPRHFLLFQQARSKPAEYHFPQACHP
jgi:hypothetical protein